jgi:hypothetical protein
LRRDAFRHSAVIRAALLAARNAPELEPPLDPFRAWFMGAALLSFDFDYGDLIRWLGGEYTNSDRNWDELLEHVIAAQQHEQRPGYPKIEAEMAIESFRCGVPLEGQFSCQRSDLLERLQYDNHPPLKNQEAEVRGKFGKEEAKSFHIAFPRFVAYYIFGLFLAPLSWVIRKGKGRIVVDCSNKLTDDDSGAANDYIPRTGTEGRERENPAVYYGKALLRHIIAIWNLRIDHPLEDILQHTDDIDSAFRRMLYHPDLAIAFAYVFMEFLIVPVGQIFGSRNAPAFWCMPSELRAHMAAVLDYSKLDLPLADSVRIPDESTAEEKARIVQAVPDAVHQGTPQEYADRHHHATFVDDNVKVAIRSRMTGAIRSSEGSAYDTLGRPEEDRRGSCLVPAKFPMEASTSVEFLGYIIDTVLLRVEWPADKVATLRKLLHEWIHHTTARTPAEIARLLGYVRNGAFLCPMGNFMSIRLQWVLNEAIKRDGINATAQKRWWKCRRVHIPASVTADLRLMFKSLLDQPDGEVHAWMRPISLLIPREATEDIRSDACYNGLGGWSPSFKFVWRVTRDELVKAGFKMKELDQDGHDRYRWCKAENLPPEHAECLHINPLEFIAIIINCWFAILEVRKDPGKPGGHIIAVRADNTSALSWLKYAARSQRRVIRNLAYLLHGLILFSQTAEIANFNGRYLPGPENEEADAASRPELFPSLATAIAGFSQLQTCRPFQVPFGLLSTIARWTSYTEIEAQYVGEMINLMTLVPKPFPDGWQSMTSVSGVYRRSRQTAS